MTIAIANLSYANTFGHLVNKVNQMADALSTVVLTVGGSATGNSTLVGTLTVNTVATDTLSSATLLTLSGNVQSTGNLVTTGAVNFKGTTLFDSVSQIRIVGANTTNQFLAANSSTGVLEFRALPAPRFSTLADFNQTGLANGSIAQYNVASNTWVVGTLTSIPTTSVGNLAIGTLTSNLVQPTGNVALSNNTIVTVASTKRVGMGGITSPQATLHINGSAFLTGDWVANFSSDRLLKEDVRVLEGALEKLNKLRGVRFKWVDQVDSDLVSFSVLGTEDVGVIAQEVAEVLPEAVTLREDGYYSVSYHRIIPLLIQAIKELELKLEERS